MTPNSTPDELTGSPTKAWQILAATVMLGAAVGLTYSGMPNVIVESVPAGQTGVATGMNANIRTLGSALGGQVTTSIVTTTIVTTTVVGPSSSALAYPSSRGFTISFIVLAVISLGAAVVAARVPGHRSPAVSAEAAAAGPGRGCWDR